MEIRHQKQDGVESAQDFLLMVSGQKKVDLYALNFSYLIASNSRMFDGSLVVQPELKDLRPFRKYHT